MGSAAPGVVQGRLSAAVTGRERSSPEAAACRTVAAGLAAAGRYWPPPWPSRPGRSRRRRRGRSHHGPGRRPAGRSRRHPAWTGRGRPHRGGRRGRRDRRSALPIATPPSSSTTAAATAPVMSTQRLRNQLCRGPAAARLRDRRGLPAPRRRWLRHASPPSAARPPTAAVVSSGVVPAGSVARRRSRVLVDGIGHLAPLCVITAPAADRRPRALTMPPSACEAPAARLQVRNLCRERRRASGYGTVAAPQPALHLGLPESGLRRRRAGNAASSVHRPTKGAPMTARSRLWLDLALFGVASRGVQPLLDGSGPPRMAVRRGDSASALPPGHQLGPDDGDRAALRRASCVTRRGSTSSSTAPCSSRPSA